MARRSTLRASDADREQIADVLRRATAEGRLLAEELEDRLGRVFSARTYGELDATVADLPVPARRGRRQLQPRSLIVPAILLALAIPVVLAVITAVVFVLTGVLAMWLVWVVIAWWVFGHRRPYHTMRHLHRAGHWSYSQRSGRV